MGGVCERGGASDGEAYRRRRPEETALWRALDEGLEEWLSGLEEQERGLPLFVKRELRRGNRYNAVVLDPPSYGHGRRGEVWRLAKHLGRLLELCAELTAGRRRFVLLTAHTPDYGPERLKRMMSEALGQSEPGTLTAGSLTIPTPDGREMPSGTFVRWERS